MASTEASAASPKKQANQPTNQGSQSPDLGHGEALGGCLSCPARDIGQPSPQAPPWDHVARCKEQSINNASFSIRSTRIKS